MPRRGALPSDVDRLGVTDREPREERDVFDFAPPKKPREVTQQVAPLSTYW